VKYYQGSIAGWNIEILTPEEGNGKCLLFMRLIEFDIEKGGEYPSIKAASSDLRANLTYADAIDFLYLVDMPHDSEWWHLNYDNPHRKD